MIISFAWTTKALLAGRKTCTRRRWSDTQFQRWVRAWEEGRHVHDAWDQLPFVAGSQEVVQIRLTCKPYRERLADMPESDLEAEGGLWASKEEFIALFGGNPEEVVAVLRFETTSYHPDDNEFTITVPEPLGLERCHHLWKDNGCVELARAIVASIRQDLKENDALVIKNGRVIFADELQSEGFGDIIEMPVTMVEEVS